MSPAVVRAPQEPAHADATPTSEVASGGSLLPGRNAVGRGRHASPFARTVRRRPPCRAQGRGTVALRRRALRARFKLGARNHWADAMPNRPIVPDVEEASTLAASPAVATDHRARGTGLRAPAVDIASGNRKASARQRLFTGQPPQSPSNVRAKRVRRRDWRKRQCTVWRETDLPPL